MSAERNECRVEVFSRVTGFFRPVREWHSGKQEEFKDRKKFNLAERKEPDYDGAR